MKILIACEESQTVCKAFRAKGHEAYSCDILPCSGGHPEWHIQGNVLDHLEENWDMMIAHPPCTHLAVSGAAWFKNKQKEQMAALRFVRYLLNCDIPKIALENPISIISTRIRKPDQIIRPFMFGENSTKATCLWLKNLPLLKPTKIITTTRHTTKSGKSYDSWWWQSSMISNLKKRAMFRSKTFQGIADAMASQWS